MRVNPSSLPRPEPARKSETFTDPTLPGFLLRLTFEFRGDAVSVSRLSRLAGDYIRDFVTGREDASTKERIPPAPLLFDGEVLPLDENTAAEIAILVSMQVPDEGEAPYDITEWLGFAYRTPQAFAAIVAFCDDLRREARETLKNVSPGVSATLSAASLTPPADTPN